MRIRSTRSNLAGVDLVPFPNVTIDQNGGFGGKTRCVLYFLDAISRCVMFKLYVVYEIDIGYIFCIIAFFLFSCCEAVINHIAEC